MSDVANNPLTAGLHWRQGSCLDSTSFTQYQAVKLTGPNIFAPCDISDINSSVAGIVLADRSPGQPRSVPIASLTSDSPLPVLFDGVGSVTAGDVSTGFLTLSSVVPGRFSASASGLLRALNNSGAVQDALVLAGGLLGGASSAGASLYFTPEAYGAIGDGVADDIDAFEAMVQAMPLVGGVVMLGTNKTYYISRTWHITRTMIVRGSGSGFNGAGVPTKFTPAPGMTIVIDTAATAAAAGFPGEPGAGKSQLEDFVVIGTRPDEWEANTAYAVGDVVIAPQYYGNFTFYTYHCTVAGTSGGTAPAFTVRARYNGGVVTEGATFTDGGVTWQALSAPGIYMKSSSSISRVEIQTCAGDGFYLFGHIGSGSNVNGWRLDRCTAQLNLGRGITAEGSDGQAGLATCCSTQNNWSGGYLDCSDVGNTWVGCSSESDGIQCWVFPNLHTSAYDPLNTGTPTVCPNPDTIDVFRKDNGGTCFYYVLDSAPGITGATEPVWPTVIGNTVVDGAVTWRCAGEFLDSQAFLTPVSAPTVPVWIGCYVEPNRHMELYGGCWIGHIGPIVFSYDSTLQVLDGDGFGITQLNHPYLSTPQVRSTLGSPDGVGGVLYWAKADRTLAWRMTLSADGKYWYWIGDPATTRMLLCNDTSPEGLGEWLTLGLFFAQGAGTNPRSSSKVTFLAAASGEDPDTSGSTAAAVIGDLCFNRDAGTYFPDGWRCVQSYNPVGPVPAVWEEFTLIRPRYLEPQSAGTGSPYVISHSHGVTGSGTTYTNLGTATKVAIKLPAVSVRTGIKYSFIVEEPGGAGLRVVAPTGEKIRLAHTDSSASGYIECTSVGGIVALESIGSADPIWVATSIVGTWTAA